MIILQKIFNKNFPKILMLLFVLMLFQSCKVYQKSTSLEQDSQAQENGFVKVTMVNGAEYIYENIEFSGNTYYGVKTVDSEKTKTVLLKEDVMKVERRNKNSFGFLGMTIVVASVISGILMFL
jgi:hypothetical protein